MFKYAAKTREKRLLSAKQRLAALDVGDETTLLLTEALEKVAQAPIRLAERWQLWCDLETDWEQTFAAYCNALSRTPNMPLMTNLRFIETRKD